jgi:hypothetical protein
LIGIIGIRELFNFAFNYLHKDLVLRYDPDTGYTVESLVEAPHFEHTLARIMHESRERLQSAAILSHNLLIVLGTPVKAAS